MQASFLSLVKGDKPSVCDGPTLLEVVAWNERRVADGHAPFGSSSLVRILRGDEYALMHNRPPGPAADARRQMLRSCPYWGVCRTLRRPAAVLQALFDRLVHEQYVQIVMFNIGNDRSYAYPKLSERGAQQLGSNERLGWE